LGGKKKKNAQKVYPGKKNKKAFLKKTNRGGAPVGQKPTPPKNPPFQLQRGGPKKPYLDYFG